MDIIYAYQKRRSQFGRQPDFEDTDIIPIINKKPNLQLQQEFIERNPCDKAIQHVPEMSIHEVNTEIKDLKDSGMLHLEGGWTKDVNPADIDATKRYCKKVENNEKYLLTLKSLAEPMNHYLKQNIALNIYEEYFEDTETSRTLLFPEPASAKVLTIFKDPCTKFKRTATSISWMPTDGKKLAVSYCRLQRSVVHDVLDTSSYIWDIHNPNTPDLELTPGSPLCCIEYNPKETTLLIAGSLNGTLCFFDTRRGSQPVDYSKIDNSHQDPVYGIKWIQSKHFTEFCSISTDGQLLVWDIRNLSNPIDAYPLEITADNKGYKGPLGALCMDYDLVYSPHKFLLGTEQGICVTWNRKLKKKDKVDRAYLGHHGPIYAIQRNPFMPKYHLSIGDWTARIWTEDFSFPIMTTNYHESYFTSGCWSNSRPGVFFITRMDGTFDVWDLLYSHSKAALSINLSDSGLYSVKDFNGKFVAVGGHDGSVHYVELSGDLSNYFGDEKQSVQAEKKAVEEIFDRECKRERALDAMRKEMSKKKDKKEQKQKPQPNDTDQLLEKITNDFYKQLENAEYDL